MQSVGNDYIVLDAFAHDVPTEPSALGELALAMCDRHFGVGADSILLITPPADQTADAVMTVLNADGSDGGMCGNGIRCAAKLLVERDHASPDTHNRIVVRVADRLVTINVHLADDRSVEAATADMGPPILELERIPVEVLALEPAASDHPNTFAIDETEFVPVSMGNPHAVVFTEQPEQLLFTLGPAWENHRAFPERTNVQLVHVIAPDEAILLSWERGVGHTLGCGSGACAAVVAGVLTERLSRHPVVRMPGGEVIVRWDEATNHVLLTGPAAEVFQGEWLDR